MSVIAQSDGVRWSKDNETTVSQAQASALQQRRCTPVMTRHDASAQVALSLANDATVHRPCIPGCYGGKSGGGGRPLALIYDRGRRFVTTTKGGKHDRRFRQGGRDRRMDAGWRQREQKINQGRVERPSVGEKSTKCMFGRESRMAQGCHAHTAVEQRKREHNDGARTMPTIQQPSRHCCIHLELPSAWLCHPGDATAAGGWPAGARTM